MKCNRKVWSAVVAASLTSALLASALPATAGPVAYWRFEEGPADTPVVHLSGTNGLWSPDVADSTGNGNALSVWQTGGGGGYAYKTDVPSAFVPETSVPNHFSVKNTGGGPAMWNNTLASWSPAAFTIEAMFKPENGGYRTLVGRDSRGAASNDPNLAALYFQMIPGNAVAIKFTDVQGIWHEAISAPNAIKGFDYPTDPNGLLGKWYAMSGVSDGKTLSLYLNDLSAGLGYALVAQTDLTASGSTNTALTTGMGSGSDWQPGNFSVGRGLYGGGHVDRAYGFIDEVRLSDGALAPPEFLGTSVPEPGTLSLLGLGALALIRRRRTIR